MLFGQMGASPFSTIAKGVRAGVRAGATAVQDPRLQNVANVAAQQYAPQQYAQARQVAAQVQRALRPPRQPGMYPQQMYPQQYEEPPTSPIRQGSILTLAAIAGVALILIFTMTRK